MVAADIALSLRWEALKTEQPQLRIREAAHALGTSEASLLSLSLGKSVRRLRLEPAALLGRLEALGSMMALTRNDAVVHERHGVYGPLEVQGNIGLIATPDIDLRLDFSPWKEVLAEVKPHAGRTLRSLQFFDRHGKAIHKVYPDEEDAAGPWEALVGEYLHEDQSSVFVPEPPRPTASRRRLSPEEASAFGQDWEALKDPHHFGALLRRHKVARGDALKAVEGRFTRSLAPRILRKLLEAAAARQLPIMAFVGNPGCVQIHTGLVHSIRPLGEWVNVLDPLFNLHVDVPALAEAWVVVKPSPDGPVTSVEFLDAAGEAALQLFGERKPGRAERPEWADLVATL